MNTASVFLSGPPGTWRQTVGTWLTRLGLTVCDPDEGFSFGRETIALRLDALQAATAVLAYVPSGSTSGYAHRLLDIGIMARSGRLVIAAEPGSPERDMLLGLSDRWGIPVVADIGQATIRVALLARLAMQCSDCAAAPRGRGHWMEVSNAD